MLNNIYTYFSPILGSYDKILDLWFEKWQGFGYSANCINLIDLKLPTIYDNIPTTNPKEYELACFYRWYYAREYARSSPVFITDNDVFPLSPFTPKINHILERNKVPCAVYGDYNFYNNLCNNLEAWYIQELSTGAKHISDMCLIQKYGNIPTQDLTMGADHTEIRPLLHCSYGSVSKKSTIKGNKYEKVLDVLEKFKVEKNTK